MKLLYKSHTPLWTALAVIPVVLVLSQTAFSASLADGPLVGAVTDTTAKIFLRTDLPAVVTIEYSTAPDLASPLTSTSSNTRNASNLTAILQLSDLAPDTTYYYRVLVDGVAQQVQPYPSFISSPLPGEARDFSFAVLTDLNNDQTIPAPVYETAAGENPAPAFVLQIGDFDHRRPRMLGAMRRMHREVRGAATASGRDFSSFIAPFYPVYHVWDDRDFGVDNSDKTFPGKANALRAYQEYWPSPDLPNAANGIWQSFRYAQIEVFMLDVRSNRDAATDPDDQDKSMLNGDNIANGQKEWLRNGLLNSTAEFKFITTGVPFNPSCKSNDSWGAFQTEWAEIVDFIQLNNITGVAAMSGDIHSGGAADDGTNSGIPEMSVPHTNMVQTVPMTTTIRGNWSEGWVSGVGGAGYVVVTIQADPAMATLVAKGVGGEERKRLTVSAE